MAEPAKAPEAPLSAAVVDSAVSKSESAPILDAAPSPLTQGDPGRVAAAAALLGEGLAPAQDTVAEPAKALEVPPASAAPEPAVTQAEIVPALNAASSPLTQGDPNRIAAAAALLGAGPAPNQNSIAESTPAVDSGTVASAAIEQASAPVETPAPFPDASALAAPISSSVPAAPAREAAPGSDSVPAATPASAPESAPASTPTPASETAAVPALGEGLTTAAAGVATARTDSSVKKTGCSTCGGFHSTLDGPAFHQSFGCSSGQCVPGRKGPCTVPANDCDTLVGNFVSNLWQCLCCPDPCYQPSWVPAANASFFADYARPRTVTRLRFDRLMDMTHPDRNQYFLKTTNPNFPITVKGARRNFNGRVLSDPSMNMSQLYLYQEAAAERASFFVEIPYRQINPLLSPTQAGFADMNLGSKALLFDCEMLQVSFQFRTFLPTGNAQIGLGTAHVSLDPSLLASLKLTPDTYFQVQVGNWIPLGGTSNIAGGMAYWLMSLNQVLTYVTPDSPLIATLEMDGYSFQNGGWTRSFIPAGSNAKDYLSRSGDSYFNIGPGLRQSICNKVDFGGAITWATTLNHWADPWFRLEMRFLF